MNYNKEKAGMDYNKEKVGVVLRHIENLEIITEKEENFVEKILDMFEIKSKVICGLVYIDPPSSPITIQDFCRVIIKR